jgi:hypothetical protein
MPCSGQSVGPLVPVSKPARRTWPGSRPGGGPAVTQQQAQPPQPACRRRAERHRPGHAPIRPAHPGGGARSGQRARHRRARPAPGRSDQLAARWMRVAADLHRQCPADRAVDEAEQSARELTGKAVTPDRGRKPASVSRSPAVPRPASSARRERRRPPPGADSDGRPPPRQWLGLQSRHPSVRDNEFDHPPNGRAVSPVR